MSGDRALALGVPTAGGHVAVAALPERSAFTAAPGLAYFEDCPDAILRFNAERRVVYANPAVERATAVSRWQFIEHRLEDVEHFADFAPLWNESLAAVLETQEGRWFKFSYPHPTGAKLFDVRLQIETGVEPAHMHVTAVMRDITVPKSAMRATRAASEFVEDLLASASIGISVLDRECVYRVWNEHLESLLGVSADGVLGRAFHDAPGSPHCPGWVSNCSGWRAEWPAFQPRSKPAFPTVSGRGSGSSSLRCSMRTVASMACSSRSNVSIVSTLPKVR